jgi:hypothetical protein
MPGFILILLAMGVLSKRIDILVDRGKLAPNKAVYLLATFLASWLGAANIIWAFLVIQWPFVVGGLAGGVALSFAVNRGNIVSLIQIKTAFDVVIVISSLYLWIGRWPFRHGY